jgi:hypothetical protein
LPRPSVFIHGILLLLPNWTTFAATFAKAVDNRLAQLYNEGRKQKEGIL